MFACPVVSVTKLTSFLRRRRGVCEVCREKGGSSDASGRELLRAMWMENEDEEVRMRYVWTRSGITFCRIELLSFVPNPAMHNFLLTLILHYKIFRNSLRSSQFRSFVLNYFKGKSDFSWVLDVGRGSKSLKEWCMLNNTYKWVADSREKVRMIFRLYF